MLRFVCELEYRSRLILGATSMLIITAIGLVDSLTGNEISISVFYLLGVALAVWLANLATTAAAMLV
jgi:hypothetical protein